MIKIYHNPRCRKSRAALEILKQSGKPFKTILYLKNPLAVSEIKTLLSLLKMTPMELVRTKEALWKSNYENRNLTNNEVTKTLHNHPKLLVRPYITASDIAIIVRNIENLKKIL